MLSSAALVAFVGVSDLQAARRFYGDALGLKLEDQTLYALVADAHGCSLRITVVDQPSAAPYTVLGWRVSDISSVIDQLTERGIAFTRYEGMGQDDRGIWTAPDGSKVAWFLDPDGNNLSVTEQSRIEPA